MPVLNWRRGLWLFLCLALSACSSPPQLFSLPPGAVILAFGDSLTYGSGAKRHEAYPAVLEALSGYRVVNAGVPGEVTAQGRQRLPQLLDELQPQLLILCHGGNDMIRKLGDAQAEANLRAMITAARQRGTDVVLIAVPRPGMLLSPPEFYAAIAEDMALPIEDEVLSELLASRSLKSDTIHPNAKGYSIMAEAIYSLLQERGAL